MYALAPVYIITCRVYRLNNTMTALRNRVKLRAYVLFRSQPVPFCSSVGILFSAFRIAPIDENTRNFVRVFAPSPAGIKIEIYLEN